MNALVVAGSLALLLALAGVAVLRRRGRNDRLLIEEGDAVRAADAAVAGFAGVSAAIGGDGRAAIVLGADRRVVLLKVRGARVAARTIAWDSVRATAGGMVVETGERRFGTVALPGIDALDVRRLAPELTG